MKIRLIAYPLGLFDEAYSLDRSGVKKSLNTNRKIIWNNLGNRSIRWAKVSRGCLAGLCQIRWAKVSRGCLAGLCQMGPIKTRSGVKLDRTGVKQSLNSNCKLPEIIWAIDQFDGKKW
jgi:hypothetical protein